MEKRNVQEEVSDKVFVKVVRARGLDGLNERWAGCEVAPTLNEFENLGDVRAVVLIVRNVE